ncbi:elongation factor 1-beta-like [Lineus longissimus]|uniref:elongation factor 1-beta-like n=1 Tax=Lineus longissimus TaxID=88925 RepID=UPI002B4E7102
MRILSFTPAIFVVEHVVRFLSEKMGFGDLKSDSGLKALNEFLLERSYIEGYEPSQADAVVFSALSGAPKEELCNVLRWYNHIKSYGNETKSFTGAKKAIDQYGPSGASTAKPVAESDDDDDLFGSDSDDEEEMEAYKKEQQEAKTAAQAAKKKNAPIGKSNIILAVKGWDDETDFSEVERLVKSVEHQGLLWGASKVEPVAFGVSQMLITCVLIDDECGTDILENIPDDFPDLIQSVDIVAFNKV